MGDEDNTAGGAAVTGLLLGAMAGVLLLAPWAERTVHRFAASATVAAVLLAAVALLSLIAIPAWPSIAGRLKPRDPRGWAALALTSVLLLFAAVNVMLVLNQVGDGSPASIQHWGVLDKRERAAKVPTVVGVAPPPRDGAPGERIEVFVSKNGWRRAEPGRSTLVLTLHPGVLGFAWYEEGAWIAP